VPEILYICTYIFCSLDKIYKRLFSFNAYITLISEFHMIPILCLEVIYWHTGYKTFSVYETYQAY
jgi:hypothetical protein